MRLAFLLLPTNINGGNRNRDPANEITSDDKDVDIGVETIWEEEGKSPDQQSRYDEL